MQAYKRLERVCERTPSVLFVLDGTLVPSRRSWRLYGIDQGLWRRSAPHLSADSSPPGSKAHAIRITQFNCNSADLPSVISISVLQLPNSEFRVRVLSLRCANKLILKRKSKNGGRRTELGIPNSEGSAAPG
jgi:hypothetical protein